MPRLAVFAKTAYPSPLTRMKIFGALGLGLTILILQALVPAIFASLEQTILLALHGAQVALLAATHIAAAANNLVPAHLQ